MKTLSIVLTVLAALALVFVIYVRRDPMQPTVWHVDPLTAHKRSTPNDYLLRPSGADPAGADAVAGLYGLEFTDLAHLLYQTAREDPRTELIAGDPDRGFFTLVQRSRLMGYPDAITISTVPRGPGRSSVAIWSRARFGSSDLGVNKARVTRWLGAIVDHRIDAISP